MYFRSTYPYSKETTRETRTTSVESDSHVVCMFGDHTLLSISKKRLSRSKVKIRESAIISDAGSRAELPDPVSIITPNIHVSTIVDMKIVDLQPDDSVLIIITQERKVILVRENPSSR